MPYVVTCSKMEGVYLFDLLGEDELYLPHLDIAATNWLELVHLPCDGIHKVLPALDPFEMGMI